MAKKKTSVLATQIGLGVVIAVLTFFLYDSITAPWAAVQYEKSLTALTRTRMDQVRISLRRFNEVHRRFPQTVDSLAQFVQADSILQSNLDSTLGVGFDIDSFLVSARGGRFKYALNDTGRVKIYYLQDPASDDEIGSIEPDISLLHAASWL